MQPPLNNQPPLNHQPPIPVPDGIPVALGPGAAPSGTPGRMRVDMPGFEGRLIEIQIPSMWKGVKVFLDGQEVKRKGFIPTYTLRRNDGGETQAKFKGGFLAPKIEAEGRSYHLLKQLQWYEWLWAGWPLVFVIGGGVLPILIGLGAATSNAGIMRSERSQTMKYVLTGIINLVALVFFVVLGVATFLAVSRR